MESTCNDNENNTLFYEYSMLVTTNKFLSQVCSYVKKLAIADTGHEYFSRRRNDENILGAFQQRRNPCL